MRFDDSSTTTGLSSKVTEKVTEIIGSLNIAKKRTDPKTWKSYYLSKGFGKLPSSALLIYLDDCIDELNELSFEDEFDDEIIGIQSEKVEELKSSILHLFRAILSLGDLSEKKEAVESILQGWDFEFDPEMSYDLSGGSVISGGELDSTLVQYLVDPIGGAANSIVRMNAVVTALDKSSMQLCAHPHKAVEIIFDKFDEYHPEVVAVAIFGRISNESLDQSVFQKIIHILDVDYISYLGFPKEQLLKTLTNKDLLEKVNLHSNMNLQMWTELRHYDFHSFLMSLRWFGVQGRYDLHYFSFLANYLSAQGGLSEFIESLLIDEDAELLPGYPQSFLDALDLKARSVEENFEKQLELALQLVSNESIKDPFARIGILIEKISRFESTFDGENGQHPFLTGLRSILNDLSEANEVFSTESMRLHSLSEEAFQIENITDENIKKQLSELLDLEQKLIESWRSGFMLYSQFCVQAKGTQKSRGKKAGFNVTKILNEIFEN